jgi:signal peptidase II
MMRLTFWVGFWVFLADQITKYAVVHGMNLRELQRIDVWPPLLSFRMAWNKGVNFGLGAGFDLRWVLVALAFAISGFVLWWVRRENGSRWTYVAAGLLVGGALGNVVDRLLYGAVADFLNMSCCGIENPFSFNIADVAVFLGAIGLVLFTRDGHGQHKSRRGHKTP